VSANAYQVYRKTQVSTASQGELLIMLFDGAIKFAGQAKELIEQRNYEAANEKLIRTQDIVHELISSLNLDTGEIAQSLYQLYRYMYDRLVEANLQKKTDPLQEVLHMLAELRDTWRQVVDQS